VAIDGREVQEAWLSGESEKIGVHAVVVDALDVEAKAFYERFGFMPFTDDNLRLFLPLSTIRAAAKPEQ
jgi:hypothetical protein